MGIIDMTDQKFGRYTVLSRAENDKHGNAQWLCRCECGTEKVVLGHSLRNGSILSCGCLCKERHPKSHDKSRTRLYRILQYVKGRCYNQNNSAYAYYGGRGICVCEAWRTSFSAFYEWAVSHGYAENLTLDRVDVNGNYEPSNCQWVDRKAQMRNRRGSLVFTIAGETKDLADWCDLYAVPYERTRHRVVNLHWPILDALTVPPLKKNGLPR